MEPVDPTPSGVVVTKNPHQPVYKVVDQGVFLGLAKRPPNGFMFIDKNMEATISRCGAYGANGGSNYFGHVDDPNGELHVWLDGRSTLRITGRCRKVFIDEVNGRSCLDLKDFYCEEVDGREIDGGAVILLNTSLLRGIRTGKVALACLHGLSPADKARVVQETYDRGASFDKEGGCAIC